MSSMWPLLPVTPFVRVMHRCNTANWYSAERSATTISLQISAAQNLVNHSVQVLSPETAATAARWVFFPHVSGVGEGWDATAGPGTWFTCGLYSLQLQGGGATVSDRKSLQSGTKTSSVRVPQSHSATQVGARTATVIDSYVLQIRFLLPINAFKENFKFQTAEDNTVIKGKVSSNMVSMRKLSKRYATPTIKSTIKSLFIIQLKTSLEFWCQKWRNPLEVFSESARAVPKVKQESKNKLNCRLRAELQLVGPTLLYKMDHCNLIGM